MENLRNAVIVPVSDFLYTYILIALLVGAGIYFTMRTRALQVRLARQMWRVVAGSRGDADGGTRPSRPSASDSRLGSAPATSSESRSP